MREENGIEEEPEEAVDENADEDEEEKGAAKKETIFLAGRLFREDIELPPEPASEAAEGEADS